MPRGEELVVATVDGKEVILRATGSDLTSSDLATMRAGLVNRKTRLQKQLTDIETEIAELDAIVQQLK